MGAALAQNEDGQSPAICFASKVFSKSQTNCSPKEQEFLAIVTFTRQFKHYVLEKKSKFLQIIAHCSAYKTLEIQTD